MARHGSKPGIDIDIATAIDVGAEPRAVLHQRREQLLAQLWGVGGGVFFEAFARPPGAQIVPPDASGV